MKPDNPNLPRFNLETMSGVFPGTRTAIFQRIRLRSLTGVEGLRTCWAQLLWYTEPAACSLFVALPDQQWAAAPLVHLTEPFDHFNQRLQATLRAVGWQLEACGSCRFWQRGALMSADQLPVGHCTWSSNAQAPLALPPLLAIQSNLALRCVHWQPATDPLAATATVAPANLAPMRKVAEISESKLSFWSRFKRRLLRRLRPSRPVTDWAEKLVERSGVGAGAEPCFVCQGRIANLGAIVVATPEGDKQTFSLWRCRSCYTTYLNDWIDRWERLDSLETEERYYRLAPAEALHLLQVIDAVPGAEHPGGRHERTAERNLFLRFVAGRLALSHQVKQGR
jgi:hypothetical protein